MCAALHHRGPDAAATKSWDGATLVHTRLKILDLSERGNQPVLSADGTVAVVFNGEIYNHHDLRRELEGRGHTFRSRCDAEVLPALYQEHGVAFAERLRGMFAVAVLDLRKMRLHLVRDRFGVKPLFYCVTDDAVAFASELPALLEVPGVGTQIDQQALRDFAALFYIPAPATFYRGVCALPAGHVATIGVQHGRPVASVRPYHAWRLGEPVVHDRTKAADTAEVLLDRAVKQQLESDVPLGAMLSGGIDSSLIAEAASRHVPLRTFNVRFPEAQYDETWAARSVAAAARTDHVTLDFQEAVGSWDAVIGILGQAGQPYADTSLFAAHQLSKLMRSHVTVALSGDGGDEAFAGYAGYGRVNRLKPLLALPPSARRGFYTAAGAALSAMSKLGIDHRWGNRVTDVAQDPEPVGLVTALQTWIRPSEHERLCAGLPGEPVRRHFEPTWDVVASRRRTGVDRALAVLTESYVRMRLANDYLFKIDTASMAFGLEVRVPLLDEDLFQFGLDVPLGVHLHGGVSKGVLREVAGRRLPTAVATKPKGGFGVPVDRWLDSGFRDQLREELLGPESELASWFERTVYAPVVESFCEKRPLPGISRSSHYERVMMLLAVQVSLVAARRRRVHQPT